MLHDYSRLHSGVTPGETGDSGGLSLNLDGPCAKQVPSTINSLRPGKPLKGDLNLHLGDISILQSITVPQGLYYPSPQTNKRTQQNLNSQGLESLQSQQTKAKRPKLYIYLYIGGLGKKREKQRFNPSKILNSQSQSPIPRPHFLLGAPNTNPGLEKLTSSQPRKALDRKMIANCFLQKKKKASTLNITLSKVLQALPTNPREIITSAREEKRKQQQHNTDANKTVKTTTTTTE